MPRCAPFFFALAALALPLTAWAQDSRAVEACHGRMSTSEIVDCLGGLTAQWDRQLNANYQAAMRRATPQGVTTLRAAERAWLEFRKQRCLYLSSGDGTITQIIAADCFLEMTRARAQEIAADMDGLGTN